jgi:hypothetical protein
MKGFKGEISQTLVPKESVSNTCFSAFGDFSNNYVHFSLGD